MIVSSSYCDYLPMRNVTWRAVPNEFGTWNSAWKRFRRLGWSRRFETFFQLRAECSQTVQLAQIFDSTTARAHASVAGAKGGSIEGTSVKSSCNLAARPL
jgi:transposase